MAEKKTRSIWWLASYPKSGSTWVRMFLDAYVTKFPTDFYSAFRYVVGDLQPEIYQLSCAKQLSELTTLEQFLHYPGVLMNLLRLARTHDVCIKTHNAKVKVEDIPLIIPKVTSGAVYIIRDPRDVVISYAAHFGVNLDEGVRVLNDSEHAGVQKDSGLLHIMLNWSGHVTSWVLKNRDVPITVIRYEDLLKDTIETFKKVLKGFGIAFNQKQFDFAIEQSSFKLLSDLEDKQGFPERSINSKEKFFRVGKSGQWRNILTKQQVKLITEVHGEVMSQFGYE